MRLRTHSVAVEGAFICTRSPGFRVPRYNRIVGETQVLTIALATVPTFLVVLAGILINNRRLGDTNRRIDDLRADILRRLDGMEKLFTERLLRVEQVMDARLKHLEENR